MKRKRFGKLLVNGTAYLFSVVLLLSMVAAPVIASVTANSVTSTHIKDGTILNRDIAPNKISSSRIKNYTILKEDIHSASITKWKLVTGAVTSAKIENSTIVNADISPGAAISDSKISYAQKTGHVSIHPSAFVPETDGNAYSRHDGFSLYTTAPGPQEFFAPVQLPNGAKVTKVTFETYDNNASYRVKWLLRRRIGSTLQGMTARSTTNASAVVGWQNLVTTAITPGREVVDNLNYSYYLEVQFNGNTPLVAAGRVLIEYEYTSPGS